MGGDTLKVINNQSLFPSLISLVPDTLYVRLSAGFKLDAVAQMVLSVRCQIIERRYNMPWKGEFIERGCMTENTKECLLSYAL